MGMESPSKSTLDPRAIQRASEYSQSRGGQALIIRQWGRTLHESYADGHDASHVHRVFSITKSLAAMACFAAAGEGWLSLDERVSDTIDEWKTHPAKRTITVRMLLNQTAGIAAGFPALYSPGLDNKATRAIRLPMVFSPGKQFDYGPSYFEVLEVLLTRKLASRGITARQWISSEVLAPAGAKAGPDWRTDGIGQAFLSTGAMLTARDVVAVANLMLNNGKASHRSVFPSRFVSEAIMGSLANRMYGLSFWNNQNATHPNANEVSVEAVLGRELSPEFWQTGCISRSAPDDLMAMMGSGGMRAYLVPSRGMVVVRFGNGGEFEDAEFLARLFGI